MVIYLECVVEGRSIMC